MDCPSCGSDDTSIYTRDVDVANAYIASTVCGAPGLLCGTVGAGQKILHCDDCGDDFILQGRSDSTCMIPLIFICIGALGRLIEYWSA